MDYLKHYLALIDRAVYKKSPDHQMEHHHILPVCMGGSDEEENIVALTAEEHLVAHRLLTKIYPGNLSIAHAYKKMSLREYKTLGINNKAYPFSKKGIEDCMQIYYPEEYSKWSELVTEVPRHARDTRTRRQAHVDVLDFCRPTREEMSKVIEWIYACARTAPAPKSNLRVSRLKQKSLQQRASGNRHKIDNQIATVLNTDKLFKELFEPAAYDKSIKVPIAKFNRYIQKRLEDTYTSEKFSLSKIRESLQTFNFVKQSGSGDYLITMPGLGIKTYIDLPE